MAETTVENATCENCGVDVRENTQFCYNCGKSFAETAAVLNGGEPVAISDDAKTALDDLAAKLKMEDAAASGDALALAAEERKRARVTAKKPTETIWEETESGPGVFFFAVSLVIFLIVAAVVFITIYWK